MVRRATGVQWALVAGLLVVSWLSCGSRARAAITEADARKQIGAAIKTELSDAKADVAAALSDFNVSVDDLVAEIDSVTVTPNNIAPEIAARVNETVRRITQAHMSAVSGIGSATSLALSSAGVLPARDLLAGGFGVMDKARDKMESEQAKARKKIVARVKKFTQEVPAVLSGGYAVNVIVYPIAVPQEVLADGVGGALPTFQQTTVSVVAAGSSGAGGSGVVSVAGILDSGSSDTLLVSIAGVSTSNVTATSNKFLVTRTSLTPKRAVTVMCMDNALDLRVRVGGIGIPAP